MLAFALKFGRWILLQIGDRVLIAHDVNIHDGTARILQMLDKGMNTFKHILKIGHPIKWDDMPGVIAEPYCY